MTKEKENLPAVKSETLPTRALMPGVFDSLERFEFAKQVAKVFSESDLVPQFFRGKPGNCLIALNLAERLQVDVFLLMQQMYVIYGRPGLEAKLKIALAEGHGRFGPIKYEIQYSTPPKLTKMKVRRPDACRAYATEKATGETIYGPWITWEMVEAEGWNKDKVNTETKKVTISKWETIPGMMFPYRAASWFINTNDPGATLGLATREEIEDIVQLEETEPGVFAPPKATEPDKFVEFSETIPAGTDLAQVNEFLVLVAEKNKKTVEEIKLDVSATPRDRDLFWKTFASWVKNKKPAPPVPEDKKEPVNPPDPPSPSPESPSGKEEPAQEGPLNNNGNGTNPKPSFLRKKVKAQIEVWLREMLGLPLEIFLEKDHMLKIRGLFAELTGYVSFDGIPEEKLNNVKVEIQTKYDAWKSAKGKESSD